MSIKIFVYRALRALRLHRTRPKSSVDNLSRLPAELLLMITQHLSPTSKLCLSLSSKALMSVLDGSRDLQRSSEFRHPRESGKRLPRSPYGSPFESGRWKLLRQLEDSRYRCCAGCFKLHPIDEFSSRDLRRRAEQRTCMFGPWVGIVDLCPCLHMSFRDKVKLAAQLGQETAVENVRRGSEHKNIGPDGPDWHQCSYTYGSTTVQTKCNPKLEWDGSLTIEYFHTITGDDIRRDLLPFERLVCPHRGILDHLWDVERIPRDSWALGYRVHSFEGFKTPLCCKRCWTTLLDPRWVRDFNTRRYISFSFRARRNLGRHNDLADKVWYGHTDVAFEKALPHEYCEVFPGMTWMGRYKDVVKESQRYRASLSRSAGNR